MRGIVLLLLLDITCACDKNLTLHSNERRTLSFQAVDVDVVVHSHNESFHCGIDANVTSEVHGDLEFNCFFIRGQIELEIGSKDVDRPKTVHLTATTISNQPNPQTKTQQICVSLEPASNNNTPSVAGIVIGFSVTFVFIVSVLIAVAIRKGWFQKCLCTRCSESAERDQTRRVVRG